VAGVVLGIIERKLDLGEHKIVRLVFGGVGTKNHLLDGVVLARGLITVWKPFDGERRPFEGMSDDKIVEERSVLFPYLVLFVYQSFLYLSPHFLFVFSHHPLRFGFDSLLFLGFLSFWFRDFFLSFFSEGEGANLIHSRQKIIYIAKEKQTLAPSPGGLYKYTSERWVNDCNRINWLLRNCWVYVQLYYFFFYTLKKQLNQVILSLLEFDIGLQVIVI